MSGDTVTRYGLEDVKDEARSLRRQIENNWREYHDWKREHVNEQFDSLHELQDRVTELETTVARLLEAAKDQQS